MIASLPVFCHRPPQKEITNNFVDTESKAMQEVEPESEKHNERK